MNLVMIEVVELIKKIYLSLSY